MARGWRSLFGRPRPPADPARRTLVVGLGAMKCGTTWLSDYLAAHPAFLHSPVKEMNALNQWADNPFKGRDDAYRLFRMDQIVLGGRWRDDPRVADRLRAFAQIAQIATPADYLAYFAERLRDQTHFGEISPSYALLPPETLRQVAGLADDVRFLFVMRDPARRAASHLRHLQRRVRAGVPLADLLAEVEPGHPVWLRSDYGRTLDLLAAAGVADRCRLLVFETLFDPATMQGLCDWLGLSLVPPRPEARVNMARGDDLTAAQKQALRDRLDPIYADLRRRPLPDAAAAWDWR